MVVWGGRRHKSVCLVEGCLMTDGSEVMAEVVWWCGEAEDISP